MKKFRILVPVLALLAFIGSFAIVKADDMKQGMDYAALAAKYDKLAADQDAIIAEHQSMLINTDRQNPGSEKRGGNPMNKHCNAIIKDAKKLKADYVAFAAWARLAAKENVK